MIICSFTVIFYTAEYNFPYPFAVANDYMKTPAIFEGLSNKQRAIVFMREDFEYILPPCFYPFGSKGYKMQNKIFEPHGCFDHCCFGSIAQLKDVE